MSTVSLDGSRNEFSIDDQTYDQIVALVQANKQCTYTYRDRHVYTEHNPCVGRSICLEHLLVKQPHLAYAGSLTFDRYNRRVHRFVNTKGMIFTCTEDSDDEAKEDLNATLVYYGFTPPETIEARGKSVSFYSYYARLHGDLHTASVVVLSYNHYSEKVRGEFLLYKNGETVPLNKRGEHKSLYAHAEALVEASKDANGEYHIGTPHTGRYDSDVYEVISQLESALYDVARKIINGNTAPGDVQPAEAAKEQ